MQKGIKKIAAMLGLFLAVGLLNGCNGNADKNTAADTKKISVEPTYTLVQNVYSWGASYSKVIIPVDFSSGENYVDPDDYTVKVERFDKEGELLNSGNRVVSGVYRSNEKGLNDDEGKYVTLDMAVTANLSLAQPYYTDPSSFSSTLKAWADCKYIITNKETGDEWSEEKNIYYPDEEKFVTDTYTVNDVTIPYAYYGVEDDEEHPLIVWLHGAGSGGTDIGFVTGGMLVTNFVSEEVQSIFGGANILLPQCETVWMDDGSGQYTTDGTSGYTEALKKLIDNIVENNNVDTSKIYIGGCSNGGYMTVRLTIDYPEMFAASFPVCQAMDTKWVSDEQIEGWKEVPTWFVHCTQDPTVNIESTSEALYNRLVKAGADNIHFSKYEEIIDPDYGNSYNVCSSTRK